MGKITRDRSLPVTEESPGGPSDKALLRALRGKRVRPVPIWLMRQAGRYLPEYRALRENAENFLNFCFTPDLAVEATLQPIRRYDFDAAILFSDILVIPHALGQKVWFTPGEGPALDPIKSSADMTRLSAEPLHRALEPVYETLDRLSSALPSHTTLIGFSGAPWTLACYMVEGGGSRDYAGVKHWAYRDPEGFQALIDLLVEVVAEYLIAQVRAGAEVLQLFDSWAGVLSEQGLERWSLQPLSAIVSRVKAACPETPIVLFPRGAGLGYRGFAERSGADALSLDTTMPLDWAHEHLQPQMTLQGNLDPIALLAGGRALHDGAERILGALSGGGFVFNLGHGVVPQTDPEAVAALVAQVRAYDR